MYIRISQSYRRFCLPLFIIYIQVTYLLTLQNGLLGSRKLLPLVPQVPGYSVLEATGKQKDGGCPLFIEPEELRTNRNSWTPRETETVVVILFTISI